MTENTTAQTPLTIRPAAEADLRAAYEVYYEHEVLHDPRPPPAGDVPPWLRHELATGEMWVAERAGRVVGFAAVLPRGNVVYLGELFVRTAEQSTGIGAALLRHALPPDAEDARIRCTVASSDPRALALYVRAGMRPSWTNLWLKANVADLRPLDRGDVEVVEADRSGPELDTLVQWDAEVSGRHRPVDHAYWLEEGGIPIWCQRRGRRVGYGYVRPRSGSLWTPETTTVGPIGTASAADAQDCACAVVSFACERSESVRLAIPGPHPGLRALLEAGLRIVDTETFASTAPLLDPERYVGSGDQF